MPLSVTPTSIDFGNVVRNSSRPAYRTISIINTGPSAVGFFPNGVASTTSPNPVDDSFSFTIFGSRGGTLNSGGSAQVYVQISTFASVGSHNSILYIIEALGGPPLAIYPVNLTFTVTPEASPPPPNAPTPPPTDQPPATCDQPPGTCPAGYTQAPVCPDPAAPPDNTCTPPVVVPPPGPPSEKTVSGFIYNSDSGALYGVRQGTEYQSDLIETPTQAQRVAEQIIWQSSQIIEAHFSVPFNPELFKGKTLRLKSALEGVDMTGIIKSIGHQFDVKSGLATTQIVLLASEYLFNSQIGEPLDLRT